MLKKTNSYFKLKILIACTLVLAIWSCASIQSPTGGPKDKEPPKILRESPKNFSTLFKAKEVDILLDEYFKLNNEYKEISISPALDKNPDFRIRKKTLNIKFQDTLQNNTTYTINFGNGIADYNEGNILKNYIYVFSTGKKIDSLSITGNVVDAITKLPVLDATVFLLPTSQDTLFGKKRANIFTSTDSSGNFRLKYLKEDTYRLYALKEEGGGDKVFNSTNELIGFKTDPIILNNQTDTAGLKLELFKEEPVNFRILDKKLDNTGRITYIFNQSLAQPDLRILSPMELDKRKILEFTKTRDTAFVWSPDLTFDSIQVAIRNKNVDIDTVVIKRNKKDEYKKPLTLIDNLSGGKLKPNTNLVLTSGAPVVSINPKSITLLQDSIPVAGLRIEKDSLSTRNYIFKYPWKTEKIYTLTIAENGITSINGAKNKAYNISFSRNVQENYGNLNVAFTVTPDTAVHYVVEFMNKEGIVLQTNTINKNTTLSYTMYPVGKYRFRVTYDANKNDKWDTGNVKKRLQPERTWLPDTEYTLRANWDLEEKITIPPPQ